MGQRLTPPLPPRPLIAACPSVGRVGRGHCGGGGEGLVVLRPRGARVRPRPRTILHGRGVRGTSTREMGCGQDE